MLAHKDGTKTFDELTDPEKAKSISAQITNIEAAIDNRVGKSVTSEQKRVAEVCVAQVERLLERLRAKYP